LVATTQNGSKYYFGLEGIGQAPQLAIDGGQQAVVPTTGLGANPTAIAIDSQANIYIADTTNSKILIECSATGSSAFLPACAALSGSATQAVLALSFPSGTTPVTLKGPKGVAVGADNTVYISDTGNNRVLKVNPITNAVQVLGNYVWVPGATCDGGVTPAAADCPSAAELAALPQDYIAGATSPTTPPPQYTFNAPQGLAVDEFNNVYVADTGNAAVVEIPSNFFLGGATPLLQYPGAPTFVTPVAVAIGPYIGTPGTAANPASPTNSNVQNNYIFVADQGNPDQQIIRIPPGGGDLQSQSAQGIVGLNYTTFVQITAGPDAGEFGGQGITEPNGVAVDAGGNVYVSDGAGNAVWEAPAVGGVNGPPFTLSFSGLNNPAGLALDPSGNVYVADSGNTRIVEMPRANPVVPFVPFGTVPEDLSASPSGVFGTPAACTVPGGSVQCTGVLTVTNIGNAPATLTSPFLGTISNTEFTISSTCASPLPVGTTCTISPQFLPTSVGPATSNVTVNGTQSIALTAAGGPPEINLVLSTPSLTPAAGSAPVITATATQPHVPNTTPAGTVVFTYTINVGQYNSTACGSGGSSAAITLVPTGSNNTSTATFTLPALSAGLYYTISATYTPSAADTADGLSNATPIVLKVPTAAAEAPTAASVTYTYGQAVPTITGSAGFTLPAGVTATFKAGAYPNYATSCSPAATYPITVEFSPLSSSCALGFPTVTNSGSGGGNATATESQAPLTVSFTNPVTTVYGAADYNFNSVLQYAGASTLCNDINKLSATFSTSSTAGAPQVHTSVLDVVPASPAVNPYPIYPTVVGKPISAGDYKVTISSGSDTITPAPSSISVSAAYTSTLDGYSIFTGTTGNSSASVTGIASTTGLFVGEQITGGSIPAGTTIKTINSGTAITLSASTPSSGNGPATLTAGMAAASYAITVNTLVTVGKGIPTGTVSVTDNFVPITTTSFLPTPTTGWPVVNGAIVFPSTVITIPPCSASVTTNCNPVVTLGSTTLTMYFTGTTASGSPTVSALNGTSGLAIGQVVSGAGIPTGAVITAVGSNTMTLSANATASGTGVVLTVANVTPAGGTFILPNVLTITGTANTPYCAVGATCPEPGTHYLSFAYSGDAGTGNGDAKSDFACSVLGTPATASCPTGGTVPNALIVDYPDYNLTSTSGLITVVPGTAPSGSGLPPVPDQNGSFPETAIIQINSVLAFNSTVNLSCQTQNPTWVNCFMYASGGGTTQTVPSNSTVASVLAVSTPATLPLGFNFGTAELRTSATTTVLAFLPFGVLAFCVRRRRMLSKALWVLIAVAAVSVGVSGCGGNKVDFYTPIPTGPQTVTVTASFIGNSSTPVETRTYVVPINVD
jgi:hypothetical protein